MHNLSTGLPQGWYRLGPLLPPAARQCQTFLSDKQARLVEIQTAAANLTHRLRRKVNTHRVVYRYAYTEHKSLLADHVQRILQAADKLHVSN